MSEIIHDKIIIGGGAAGIMAAYSACIVKTNAEENPDVVVLEANEKPGKKITATGNGKCNFTNLYQSPECYRSLDSEKAYRIIESFDHEDTIKLFKSMGILYTERNGYCYPYGEQARTLRDVLVNKAESVGAKFFIGKKVEEIRKEEGRFIVVCNDTSVFYSKKLIICGGGCASPVFGSDGSVLDILKGLGINIKTPQPALCGLLSDYRQLKKLDGVRLKCECSLFSENTRNIIYKERGEIIFNKKGLSGIPIMNMSRFAINELDDGKKTGIILDFFPDMDIKELRDFMCFTSQSSVMPIGTALSTMINDKLLMVMFEELLHDYYKPTDSYDIKSLRKILGNLSGLLKGMKINITGDSGFENAQTTQGGVILKEIDEKTMESYKYPGMYFAGEILDVDGMCGGYNLQWAWTTGYIAGRN